MTIKSGSWVPINPAAAFFMDGNFIMAITSASTLAQVLAQYNDNLDWDGSPTKAALALAAVRWILVNRPARLTVSGRSTDFTVLEAEKKSLEDYIQTFGSGANQAEFTRGIMLT